MTMGVAVMSRSSVTVTQAMRDYIAEHCFDFSDAAIAKQLGLSRDQVINQRQRVLKIKKTHSSRVYRIKPQPAAIMRYPLEGFCAAMQSVLQMRWAA